MFSGASDDVGVFGSEGSHSRAQEQSDVGPGDGGFAGEAEVHHQVEVGSVAFVEFEIAERAAPDEVGEEVAVEGGGAFFRDGDSGTGHGGLGYDVLHLAA